MLSAFVLLLLLAQAPTFETASIKPSPPNAECGMMQTLPGGALRVECLSLQTIIVWAYGIQDYQVSGGPGWMRTDRWNIVAKPDSTAPLTGPADFGRMSDQQRARSDELVRLRLQALLADRFQLSFHRDVREQTEYALTVAPGGSRLKESSEGARPFVRRGGRKIIGVAGRIPELARMLEIDLKRPVADQTGLTGRYDFNLEWAPDSVVPVEDSGPSIFTAIQEQLGLKLVARKGPVEILVIDKVTPPSAN